MVSNWLSSLITRFNGHGVAVAGLIVFFLIIFKDVLFYPRLILVTDFAIPSTNPYYHVISFISSWAPHNLGFASIPGWSGVLTGLFVFLSGGNQVIAQKLMLLHIPLASIFMYYFINQHATKSKFAAFTGAVLYGYSPIVLDNFAAPFLWGYAFLPLIFNFGLNILEGKPKVRNAIAVALVMAFASSMVPHLLGIIPPVFTFFLIIHLLRNRRISYLATVFKYSLLAISLYVVLSLQSYAFSILNGGGEVLSFVPPPIAQFYANYEGLSFDNLIRLTGIGHPTVHAVHYLYLQGNIFGFILPILAFSALLTAIHVYQKKGHIAIIISTRQKQQLCALSFSLVVIFTILFVESIRQRTSVFEWLYANYPPLVTLRNPLAVMMLVSLSYSVLIGITSTFIQRQLRKLLKKLHLVKKRTIERTLGGVFITSLILGAYFLYAPVYDSTLQKSTPWVDYPPIYSEVINWMRNQGEDGSFRYLLVPQSHSSQLSLPNDYPYQFLAVSGASYPPTKDYVMFAYDALVQNKTSTLGPLLALANVKYFIVTLNTTEPEQLKGNTESPMSISGDNLVGNSTEFIKAIEYQSTLQLREKQSNFIIYEVKDFIPKVAPFQNAIYVTGGLDAFTSVVSLPSFSIKNNLLIFGKNQSLNHDSIPTYVPTILFYNLDNAQIRVLSETLSANKSLILLCDKEDFFVEKLDSSSLELASFESADGISVLHGYGTISNDTLVKPEGAEGSVIYNGTSAADKLFSIVYSFPDSIDLEGVDEIRYYFRLSGVSESRNVEFGLIDDSLTRARRWNADILPSVSLDTWQEVRINLTSYSYQDSGFNISRVKRLQFTTYTSEPETKVTMCVSRVVKTKINSQFDFSTQIPQPGNYSLYFKSSMPSLKVMIKGISTSVVDKVDGWYETEPVFLSDDINVSIITPINGKVEAIALVNKAKLEDAFSASEPSISYSVKKVSETKYVAELETSAPVFLVLGESYHQDWRARIEGKELLHFLASSWSNGYYVDRAGNFTIVIEFAQQTPHIVLSVFVLSVFSLSLIFVSYDALRHYRKTKEGRKIGCSNSTFKTAD